MWILPKQLHTLAFVADTKALDLDSEEFSQICEKSLTWRGKDSVSRTWLQRWKRENWMQHLCSRTLKPSHTESFVERYLSSQEDSLVSPLVLLESVKLLKTPDISSPTSQKESESANLEFAFSKTWQESSQPRLETENQFSNMSSEYWKNWVIEQRQEYSQRKKSAHLTRENESSFWATPIANDAKGSDYAGTKENPKALYLGGQVKNWPTPTTAEGTKIGNQPNFGQVGLSNHPSIVGQPDRAKLNKSGKSQESWPTPRANKVHPEITEENREHLANRNKANLEEDIAGHCGKATGKLNPNWVEHLMGLTVGWTDLGSWETE